MSTLSNGRRFLKHKKRGDPKHRWILVEDDRLYWKESFTHSNQKERSIHFSRILEVMRGKVTKTLRQRDDADENLCFSIIAKRSTLDLEAKTVEIRNEWVCYLEAMHRHFFNQGCVLREIVETNVVLSDVGLCSVALSRRQRMRVNFVSLSPHEIVVTVFF